MILKVIVGSGITRVFKDGELHTWFMYEDEKEGFRTAQNIKDRGEFLSQPQEDGTIEVRNIGAIKLRWYDVFDLQFSAILFFVVFLPLVFMGVWGYFMLTVCDRVACR